MKRIYKARRDHYLLSTQVSPGVYASSKKHPNREVELVSVSPLSNEERELIEKTKMLKFLDTATGVPTAEQQEILFKKTPEPLPPIKGEKPQVCHFDSQTFKVDAQLKLSGLLSVMQISKNYFTGENFEVYEGH